MYNDAKKISIIAVFIITIIEAVSSLGRTTSLGSFVSYIDKCGIASLNVTSLSYSAGNIIAIAVLPSIGYFYDKISPKVFIGIFCFVFGLSFLFLGASFDKIFCISTIFVTFITLFTSIRLSIYAFSMAGRSLVASLFSNEARATVTAVSCGIISISAAVSPYAMYKASEIFSWKSIWTATASIFILIGVAVFMLFKNVNINKYTRKKCDASSDFKFLKSKKFWLFNLILSLHSMQAVGISFHIVPISNELSIEPKIILTALIPISILTLITNFLAGRLLQKIGLLNMFLAFMLNNVVMLASLLHVKYFGAYAIFIVSSAIDWGINHILLYVTWPTCFGINNVGNVNAWAIALTGIGSALGPYIFSLLKSNNSYSFAITSIMIVLVALITVTKRLKLNN